jgi:hypothetical protein
VSSSSPTISSVKSLLNAVDATLNHADVSSPYTLILGAGFSYPVVPCAREVIARVPKWLSREPNSFWKETNEQLARLTQEPVQLNSKGLPDLSTGDMVSHAYEAAMLHGLKSPGLRRVFYRHQYSVACSPAESVSYATKIVEATASWIAVA